MCEHFEASLLNCGLSSALVREEEEIEGQISLYIQNSLFALAKSNAFVKSHFFLVVPLVVPLVVMLVDCWAYVLTRGRAPYGKV